MNCFTRHNSVWFFFFPSTFSLTGELKKKKLPGQGLGAGKLCNPNQHLYYHIAVMVW